MSIKEKDNFCSVQWTSSESEDFQKDFASQHDDIYDSSLGTISYGEQRRLRENKHVWHWIVDYSSGLFSSRSEVVAGECVKCGEVIQVNEE